MTEPTYSVGDLVELDINWAWFPGEIVKIKPAHGGSPDDIHIRIDYPDGSSCIHRVFAHQARFRVRPRTAT